MSILDVQVEGRCHSDFSSVEEEFRENFASRGELGSAVCVYRDGEKVVDLWGGHRDEARTQRWTEDTIVLMSSIAKSMSALSVHMLVDRGQISLEEPVARYWPEFAQNGKENILLRHTISHQCGVIFCDAAKPGDFFDYPAQVAAIAAQEPAWPAGSKGAYNSINFGFIHGEIVRRVSGKRIRDFIREEITGPLGADYNVGLNEEELARVAPVHRNPENKFWEMGEKPGTMLNRAWGSRPIGVDLVNCRENRVGENPSSGGHGNARAIARVYAMLANNGEIDGVRLLRPETVEQLSKIQWEGNCAMTGAPRRMGLGFMHNCPPNSPMGPNMKAFGHGGSGGAFTFCDRERNMAFGYCTNFQPEGNPPGIRARSLVAAAFGKAPESKLEARVEV